MCHMVSVYDVAFYYSPQIMYSNLRKQVKGAVKANGAFIWQSLQKIKQISLTYFSFILFFAFFFFLNEGFPRHVPSLN